MIDKLMPYLEPVRIAVLVFPLIAAFFTIPFLIQNYRKYGGIAMMRVLVVYSFILYSLCAFFLTILPLPSREAVAAMAPKPIGWIPFTDLNTGLVKSGMDIAVPATLFSGGCWKAFFTSNDFFQIIANIIMQMPLGFYLRYYFRCSWKRTACIGFLVSLFYETTQFTGLWFLYPQAYRYATVDDLICNTLGCLLGFWLSPNLTRFLPSREEIDRISYAKGQQVTPLRQAVAACADGALYLILTATLLRVVSPFSRQLDVPLRVWLISSFMVYFVLLPWLTKGYTPGCLLLKFRITNDDGTPPNPWRLFLRHSILFLVEPIFFYMAVLPLSVLLLILISVGLSWKIRLAFAGCCLLAVLLCLGFLLRCWNRWGVFPHSHYSRTKTK